MKFLQLFIPLWFRIVSRLFPRFAARQAASLFQRPGNRKLRAPERLFYNQHSSREVSYEEGTYHLFEWGNPQGEIVLLVHGWNSNAGSMAGIGHRMAARGYRVIAIDLPGHGRTKRSHTNLVRMAVALEHLMRSLNGAPFSVISHSMGSAVTSFALHRTGLKANQLIFLTAPNTMRAVFEEYRDLIKLGYQSFEYLLRMVESILDADIDQVEVSSLLNTCEYDDLLIIHDRTDRVIPFDYAVDIYANTLNSRYLPLEQTGHYRMLWTEEVLDMVEDEMTGSLAPRYGYTSLDYRNQAIG